MTKIKLKPKRCKTCKFFSQPLGRRASGYCIKQKANTLSGSICILYRSNY